MFVSIFEFSFTSSYQLFLISTTEKTRTESNPVKFSDQEKIYQEINQSEDTRKRFNFPTSYQSNPDSIPTATNFSERFSEVPPTTLILWIFFHPRVFPPWSLSIIFLGPEFNKSS